MNKTGAFFLGLAASSLIIAAFVPPPKPATPPVGNVVRSVIVGASLGIDGIAQEVVKEANK